MSWLLNLLQLGKGPPPNTRAFTRLGGSATPIAAYRVAFAAKQSSSVTARAGWYYLRFIAGMGA